MSKAKHRRSRLKPDECGATALGMAAGKPVLCDGPLMPPSETLAVVGLMDAMRSRIGVRCPFE